MRMAGAGRGVREERKAKWIERKPKVRTKRRKGETRKVTVSQEQSGKK